MTSTTSKKKGIIVLGLILLLFLGLTYLKEHFDENGRLDFITHISENSHLQKSSCIDCHGDLKGLSPYHKNIGCVSCHKGNNENSIKDSSHLAMISIPGNLQDADQTCGICHVQALDDIKKSIMTTNSGILSIDRYIFGETDDPNLINHIKDLGYSPADVHVRNLCSHCHLGNEKKEIGPISELSRGGGCNACHLNYANEAKQEIKNPLVDSIKRLYHPSLDLNVSDDHCFGCHSRSGRIATNYEGWHETLLKKDSIEKSDNYRVLEDDRVFRKVTEDVHHTIGLACIDCHNYEDIMGDGKSYAHEEDAVKISCEDCHFEDTPYTLSYNALGFTQRRILKIREYDHNNSKIGATKKDTTALLNVYLDERDNAFLIRKSDGKKFAMSSPSGSCNKDAGHQDISCSACHSAWAPQCIGCHSDFDRNASGYDLYKGEEMQGSWIEYASEFLAEEPSLGVRRKDGKREIQSAIPGMIMTLDQSDHPNSTNKETTFHRLFAPASPHTISKKGRTCSTCHTNPLALGYGRGVLRFDKKWTFDAEYANLEDGLPSDAWIGFMEDLGDERYSTRVDFLPFSKSEQERILTVGACLSCHKEDSKVMMNSLSIPFLEYKKKMSSECVEAVF